MYEFANSAVKAAFNRFPTSHKAQLLQLRDMILATGDALNLPEGIEETLKWGEPSYLPNKPKLGSTIRISQFDDNNVGLYFNSPTMLVENFRSMYGDKLSYSKNRAIVFSTKSPLPENIIANCTRMALRYHLDKVTQVIC